MKPGSTVVAAGLISRHAMNGPPTRLLSTGKTIVRSPDTMNDSIATSEPCGHVCESRLFEFKTCGPVEWSSAHFFISMYVLFLRGV